MKITLDHMTIIIDCLKTWKLYEIPWNYMKITWKIIRRRKNTEINKQNHQMLDIAEIALARYLCLQLCVGILFSQKKKAEQSPILKIQGRRTECVVWD